MRVVLTALSITLSSTLLAQDVEPVPAWSVSKTEFAHPDLQGNWGNFNQTPLQRPLGLGTKQSYSDEETREVINAWNNRFDSIAAPLDPDRPPPPEGVPLEQITDINFNPERMTQINRINGEYRTSLIIDPANGRLPYREDREKDIYEQRLSEGFGRFDGPEIRPANERCLNYPAQLPLIFPLGSSHTRYMQIVQTADYVILYGEYSTGLRIIRLDSEHPKNGQAKWLGDSIAHWEGDSLVIHTEGFRPLQSRPPLRSTAALEITETLTASSADELIYRYTISDSNIYSQPFTAEMLLDRLDESERLYESACHEGNYSLPGILAGARRQEQDSLR